MLQETREDKILMHVESKGKLSGIQDDPNCTHTTVAGSHPRVEWTEADRARSAYWKCPCLRHFEVISRPIQGFV